MLIFNKYGPCQLFILFAERRLCMSEWVITAGDCDWQTIANLYLNLLKTLVCM